MSQWHESCRLPGACTAVASTIPCPTLIKRSRCWHRRRPCAATAASPCHTPGTIGWRWNGNLGARHSQHMAWAKLKVAHSRSQPCHVAYQASPTAAARTLYELFGLQSSCSMSDLRHAYRQLATHWHPDVMAEADQEEATRKFQILSQAYQVLKNPDLRRRYDQNGLKGLGREYAPLRDYFQAVTYEDGGVTVSSQDTAGVKGAHVCIVVGVEFHEAMVGVERPVQVIVDGMCSMCQGSGRAPVGGGGGGCECHVCRGSGDVLRNVWQPSGIKVTQMGECPGCGGSGLKHMPVCPQCEGQGHTPVTRRVTLRVPGGVQDGSIMKVSGCGHAGRWGGPAGDLIVQLKVHDEPDIERRGSHLYSTIKCGVWLAMLGGVITVRSVRGERLLHVPPGSQHGDVVELSHAGVAVAHAGVVEYGHHFFQLEVTLPSGLNLMPQEQVLLKQLDMVHHACGSYSAA